MDRVGPAAQTTDADVLRPDREGRSPVRRLAVPIVVLLALALGYLFWWSQPSAFDSVGNEAGAKESASNLQPVTVEMLQLNRGVNEQVRISSITPRVSTNSADADISFALCRISPSGRPGVAYKIAADACDGTNAPSGQQLHLDSAGTDTTIVMTVVPRRAGKVVVNGMDVSYSRGAKHLFQRGSQATGPVVVVTVER